MINCGCGNEIHPERVELGYKVCLNCGDKAPLKNKKYGYMHFGHKNHSQYRRHIQTSSRQLFSKYQRE
jgi:hypothetical protein